VYPDAEIATALRCALGQAAIDVPGTVLFAARERAVFVPSAAPTRQAEALGFFSTGVLRRIAGAVQLQIWRWTGIGLRPAQLSLPAEWRDRFDAELEAASLYCGSPGPLQKLSLLLPARRKEGVSHVVKVSLRPSADAAVAREARCLANLAVAGAELGRHIPALIAEGVLASGRRYLVSTAASGRRGRVTLSAECLHLLQSIARATRTDMRWEQGDALGHTRERLRALGEGAVGADVRGLLEQALGATETQLRGKRIPHTLMHGDFTRFNICRSEHGFVVFDWEYWRSRSNPIADALHYRLSGRRAVSATRMLRAAIGDAEAFVDLAFEDWRPTTADLDALALHALVDTVVFYATADARVNTRSFVVRRYLGLIASRRSWMRTDSDQGRPG